MASKSPHNTDAESETGDEMKMTPEEQSAQFIKTARELECDESEEAFNATIAKVLKPD